MAVSFFGDGASNEGAFHEAINLAAVWKLPVIFYCENNGYGISVPQWQSTSVEDIGVRAAAYGIPGKVSRRQRRLRHSTRRSARPSTAPAAGRAPPDRGKTSRWYGHWTGDPQVYRSREEVESWKLKDPIKRMRERMIAEGTATAEELDAIEAAAVQAVEEATEFALNSPPEPDPATVMDDVFYVPNNGGCRMMSVKSYAQAIKDVLAEEMRPGRDGICHGRGYRRAGRHLRVHPGPAQGNLARSGCATPPSPKSPSSAPAWARR